MLLILGQTFLHFRTIVDVNIDAFDEKPWKHPGADITDFFNFDFDEESWKNYCNHLVKNVFSYCQVLLYFVWPVLGCQFFSRNI